MYLFSNINLSKEGVILKKCSYKPIIFAVIFLLLFIVLARYTEHRNLESLKGVTYSVSVNGKDINLPEVSDKAISYKKSNLNIWTISFMLTFLIPIFFLVTGLSKGIRDFIQKRTRRFFIISAVYFIIFTFINSLLTLPLDFYSSFIQPHNFGLSNQTFTKWLTDSLKSVLLSSVTGALFIWFPYYVIRKKEKLWWLYMGFLSIPILFFMTFVSPFYVDPIFNKYEDIKDKNLKQKIESQLKKANLEGTNVYQVNKSVDTKEMNAYMTGVFNSKRIVLWDTTINNLSDEETLGVLAHEMGHYVMGHVWKSIILGGVLIIFVLYLTNKSVLYIINLSKGKFGFNKISDIAALPLIILVLNFYMFLSNPITNTVSRRMEIEADRFELELTQNTEATITSTIKLHEGSLALPYPGKLFEVWYYSHPPYLERVEFAKDYAPWEKDEPLKYEKYFNKN